MTLDSAYHWYRRDASSGAGNCVCGRQLHHKLHPHIYKKAYDGDFCVCGMHSPALQHEQVFL